MSATTSFRIENRVEELDRIFSAVEEIGQREDWPSDLEFKVKLVLEEICINVINYGHSEGLHTIDITISSRPDTLSIEVTDDGRPFDPVNDSPEPDLTAPIEDRPVGGLGVHLVQTLMDEMHYRRKSGKNHVTLIARRS